MSNKNSNEITVKVICDKEQLIKILLEQGFEEVRKFSPCLEVAQAEDAIYHNDVKDITDVLEEMYTQINSKKGE